MPIKVAKTDRLFVIDVSQKGRGGLKLSDVQPVDRLPSKLGIDQVAGSAKVGLRLGSDGKVSVVGLDQVVRRAAAGKDGRC